MKKYKKSAQTQCLYGFSLVFAGRFIRVCHFYYTKPYHWPDIIFHKILFILQFHKILHFLPCSRRVAKPHQLIPFFVDLGHYSDRCFANSFLMIHVSGNCQIHTPFPGKSFKAFTKYKYIKFMIRPQNPRKSKNCVNYSIKSVHKRNIVSK